MIKESGLWNEMEKLRDGLEDLFKTGLSYSGRAPASRLHEKADEFVVLVELAGVPKEAVQVTYSDRRLLVSGTKPGPRTEDGAVLRDETFFGAFERSVPLPAEVDGEAIQARFQDGVLIVRLPKAAMAKARSVKID